MLSNKTLLFSKAFQSEFKIVHVKVHRILLGRALFEFCRIIRNQNNQTKQLSILWEGQLNASFRNILLDINLFLSFKKFRNMI